MPRWWIAPLLLWLLIVAAAVAAQETSQPKPHPTTKKAKTPATYTPGVTTITSFDKEHTVVGWLEIVPIESKIYHETRTLRVLVPANYFSPRNARRSYPVLYLQDGQNLFDEVTSPHGEWRVDETVEHLVGGFKIAPMFVVGIDNGGEKRASEYLPYPDAKNAKDNVADEKSVHGKDYARFLMTEVMPFIEKKYRITRGAANTGVGGSSYGGIITLYSALAHPGVFGHVLVESPPLWVGDGQLLKDAEKAKQLPAKMYLGTGDSEDPADPELSSQVVKNVQELETILRNKGMNQSRLQVVVEKGGQHSEAAWARRLPDALLFLYGK